MIKKIKLIFLVGTAAIFINGLAGCNSKQNVGSQISASDTLEPKQTMTSTGAVDRTSSITDPLADTDTKKEYSDNLCKYNEEVLFSFKIENSAKTLSICLSNEQPDYIVYRFGTKDKIELEFPGNKADSWSKFTYSYYLRGGGAGNEGIDMNYLTFENGGYEYQIYQEYISKDNKTQVGVKITEKSTKKETDIKGLSDSIEGSLMKLRENKKIKIEIL